jgi:hypothetical protein
LLARSPPEGLDSPKTLRLQGMMQEPLARRAAGTGGAGEYLDRQADAPAKASNNASVDK